MWFLGEGHTHSLGLMNSCTSLPTQTFWVLFCFNMFLVHISDLSALEAGVGVQHEGFVFKPGKMLSG